MRFGKYVAEGMIALGVLGASVSGGYILYHDQIDKELRDDISNVEKILTYKEVLGKLNTSSYSDEYKKATEQEIERLEGQYQEQANLSDLSSLRRQRAEIIIIQGLESIGFFTSLGLLGVGLAKRFPGKKEE